MTYTAYFSRKWGSIDGFFTIQEFDEDRKTLTKIFDRLPARSGQRLFAKTEWVRAKSPIPKGRYFLWLECHNRGILPIGRGIGEFHPISSGLDNHRLIVGTDGRTRTDIGQHPENDIPGTAGCIGLLHDTPERKAEVLRLFNWYEEYRNSAPYIDFVVL